MVSGEWIVVQLIEMLLFSLKRSLFSGWITCYSSKFLDSFRKIDEKIEF